MQSAEKSRQMRPASAPDLFIFCHSAPQCERRRRMSALESGGEGGTVCAGSTETALPAGVSVRAFCATAGTTEISSNKVTACTACLDIPMLTRLRCLAFHSTRCLGALAVREHVHTRIISQLLRSRLAPGVPYASRAGDPCAWLRNNSLWNRATRRGTRCRRRRSTHWPDMALRR